jgi:ABC-type bacteriocin/lantibiotic exporter with double-glycine peptidase domain
VLQFGYTAGEIGPPISAEIQEILHMIQFTNVVKTYQQGNNALNGATMQIEDGEFVFLIGPSGSGKSTIIKMITGELKPTSGTVHVNGYSLERIRKREIPYLRRTVGVVFQDFRLIDKMTVYENVAFAMRVVGAKEKDIKYFVRHAGLPVFHNPCPEDHNTERSNMDALLSDLERKYPGLRHRIFGAMCRGEIDGFKSFKFPM